MQQVPRRDHANHAVVINHEFSRKAARTVAVAALLEAFVGLLQPFHGERRKADPDGADVPGFARRQRGR